MLVHMITELRSVPAALGLMDPPQLLPCECRWPYASLLDLGVEFDHQPLCCVEIWRITPTLYDVAF